MRFLFYLQTKIVVGVLSAKCGLINVDIFQESDWCWLQVGMEIYGFHATMPLSNIRSPSMWISPLHFVEGLWCQSWSVECDVAVDWVVRIMSEVPTPSCRHFISHPSGKVDGRVHIGCEFSNGFFIVRSGVAMSIWHCHAILSPHNSKAKY